MDRITVVIDQGPSCFCVKTLCRENGESLAGVAACAFYPSTQEAEASEFKASLVDRANSRTARTMKRAPLLWRIMVEFKFTFLWGL